MDTEAIRMAIGGAVYERLRQPGMLIPDWEKLSETLREVYAKIGDRALCAYAEHGKPQSSGDFYRYIEAIEDRDEQERL